MYSSYYCVTPLILYCHPCVHFLLFHHTSSFCTVIHVYSSYYCVIPAHFVLSSMCTFPIIVSHQLILYCHPCVQLLLLCHTGSFCTVIHVYISYYCVTPAHFVLSSMCTVPIIVSYQLILYCHPCVQFLILCHTSSFCTAIHVYMPLMSCCESGVMYKNQGTHMAWKVINWLYIFYKRVSVRHNNITQLYHRTINISQLKRI